MMENKNDTQVFGQKKQQAEKKQSVAGTVGAAVGGVAVGMGMSAFINPDTPIDPVDPVDPVDPANGDINQGNTVNNNEPSGHEIPQEQEIVVDEPREPEITPQEPELIDEPADEPTEVVIEVESTEDTIPEPVMPVEEIDPNDIDMADVIEDVSLVEVVYDINGNQMVVATAHNAEMGEFYLVDVDVDGDFDVILDSTGMPVMDLTGDNDQLITITDLEAKITDDYIPRSGIDDMIAQTNMIGEQIQNDITIIEG